MQFGSKAVLGPNEAGFDVVDVLDESSLSEDDGDFDTIRVKTGPEPVSEMGDLGTGPEPIPGVDEVEVEPPSVFEEMWICPLTRWPTMNGMKRLNPLL